MGRTEKKEANALQTGDRIHCHSWKDLKNTAFRLSSEGYGVGVIGFSDMSDNILTVTDLPKEEKG